MNGSLPTRDHGLVPAGGTPLGSAAKRHRQGPAACGGERRRHHTRQRRLACAASRAGQGRDGCRAHASWSCRERRTWFRTACVTTDSRSSRSSTDGNDGRKGCDLARVRRLRLSMPLTGDGMARMIPPVPASETPDSERHVYERFQSVLPGSWTVIHSQRFLLPKRRGKREERVDREGELDFLVLDPLRGALGLEVKGGGVRRTADGWRSTDRQGEEHVIKNPGEQASKAVHAIRRYLDDAAGFGGKGLRCRFGWGVVLPDIECPFDMGPDLPRDVILDRSDFVRLREAVDRVFARRIGDGQPLSQVGADAFEAALVERYRPASRLALQFKEEVSGAPAPHRRADAPSGQPRRPRPRGHRRVGGIRQDGARDGEGAAFGSWRPTRVAAVLQYAARGGTCRERGRFRGRDVPRLLPPPRASGGAAVRTPGAGSGHALLGGGGADAVAGSPAAASPGSPVRRHRRGRGAGLPARLVALPRRSVAAQS